MVDRWSVVRGVGRSTNSWRTYVTKGEKERIMLLENQAAILTTLIALTPPSNAATVNNLLYHSAKTIAYIQGAKK